MKRIFNWVFTFSIVLFISLCVPTFVHAGPDADQPPCVGPDPDLGDCPIDSGLLILISIGAAYGIKKVVDSRKEQVIE